MDKELNKILHASTFSTMRGTYKYARAKKLPGGNRYFATIKDHDEITVVAEKRNLVGVNTAEVNKEDYCLIALNVSVPFYSVGFLSAISGTIAQSQINILILSTYSKDYILVPKQDRKKTIKALLALGLKELTTQSGPTRPDRQ